MRKKNPFEVNPICNINQMNKFRFYCYLAIIYPNDKIKLKEKNKVFSLLWAVCCFNYFNAQKYWMFGMLFYCILYHRILYSIPISNMYFISVYIALNTEHWNWIRNSWIRNNELLLYIHTNKYNVRYVYMREISYA